MAKENEAPKEKSVVEKVDVLAKRVMVLEGKVDRVIRTMAELLNWMNTTDRVVAVLGKKVVDLERRR